MGTLAQKLQYTLDSVDDIQKALEEKGFDMSDVELSKYGALIRLITGNSGSDGGGSSTGTEGQPLNGLKIYNAFFTAKKKKVTTINNITVNDIVNIKQKNIFNNTDLIEYINSLSLLNSYITKKDILQEYTDNITVNATITGKKSIYVTDVIKKEE